jgi:SIR2-like domain
MPELLQFHLYTHSLDTAKQALLARVVKDFHTAQNLITLEHCGERAVPHYSGRASWSEFLKQDATAFPEITVTGLPLNDNWFSHASLARSLITAADWHVAFRATDAPPAAPDAYLLHELTTSILCAAIGRPETEITHYKTTGCISDMCSYKPDMAIKLRSGFLCMKCRNYASEAGISGIYLDAIQALMERTRFLALGRVPQTQAPTSPAPTSDSHYIQTIAQPTDFHLLPILKQALQNPRNLTVLVGSGLSLQSDVTVAYPEELGWTTLPKWTEIPDRLKQRICFYRGGESDTPMQNSLEEFLLVLDILKARLGPNDYYRRVIYEIFLPQITDMGLANRLLFRLPVRWILTTNYDSVLNYAAPQGTLSFTWTEARPALEYITRVNGPAPLVKLHGCASRPESVILTKAEYVEQSRHSEYVALRHQVFAQQNILFLGYGMNDPLDLDLAIAAANSQGAAQGDKFALVPKKQSQILRERFPNVTFLPF